MNTHPDISRIHPGSNPRKHLVACAGRHERGTALIMSLVILMILTILGITAMSTASLEERMSGNTQESTRAFQAAESGLNEALNTTGSLDLNITTTNSFTYNTMNASAAVITKFIQFTPPKRGSGYGNTVEAANFDQGSTGSTGVGGKAVVHQGVAQIVPKSN
jgi:Tfp pilus assembly protein PilX